MRPLILRNIHIVLSTLAASLCLAALSLLAPSSACADAEAATDAAVAYSQTATATPTTQTAETTPQPAPQASATSTTEPKSERTVRTKPPRRVVRGYWGHYGHRDYPGSRRAGYYGVRFHGPWYRPWWPSYYVARDRASETWGALDLDVRPEKAEVFVDGQRVGVADDFDGFPEFLWLEEGTYDLAIYAQGYETIFRQVTIYPSLVIDVEDHMRLGASVHPDDHGPTTTVRRDARRARSSERQVAPASSPAPSAAGAGRLLLSILPKDAAVYLDGHFLGTAGEVGYLSAGLLVTPGEHRVELVRPGFATYSEELVVPPGEKRTIEVELVPSS